MPLIEWPSNQEPESILSSEDLKFVSSNPACPISSYQIVDNAEKVGITDGGVDGFEIFMKSDYSSVPADVLTYTVQGFAEGGASFIATGTMRVGVPEYDCREATTKEWWEMDYLDGYDIPNVGGSVTE